MGLLVDIPIAGFGNSNDGNSARRFFQDPKLTSEITRVETLIYRLKIILEVISSGHEIDVAKFEKYAYESCSWYPMTSTMHKILVHGAEIISHALLPIGQLSEEAAEAQNKHFRTYRQGFARKFSRDACNRDVIHRLLLNSDPLLTSIRPLSRKSTNLFSKETIHLLLPPKAAITSTQESSKSVHEDEELNEESSCESEYFFSVASYYLFFF
ncbi:unnamed protein product [Euphydryas editha]|uniref:Uncharacterized protein n=1 Tax=Euphydryas editha TaxID=104508 RepID=A0AAU9TPT1_EUPED|nr:unnamed protein product [Euphydryas editha]